MTSIYPYPSRGTSLALGHSYDCPGASEITLKEMGEIDHCENATKYYKAGTMPWTMRIIMMPTLLSMAALQVIIKESLQYHQQQQN